MREDIVLEAVDPLHEDAVAAVSAYLTEISGRFEVGFDVAVAITEDAERLRPPVGVFVVARAGGEVVGCGGVRTLEPGVGELKRMWVSDAVRGQGLGRRLLADLEARARTSGHRLVRLDTNSALVEAIAMYESAGYTEIGRYHDGRDPDRFFEKSLSDPDADLDPAGPAT